MDKPEASIVTMAGGTVEPPKMPSADLINYRFDQADKQFAEISGKIDHLANNFVTKEELQVVVNDLESFKNDRKWWTRMMTSASISALLVSLGTLIVYLILRIKG